MAGKCTSPSPNPDNLTYAVQKGGVGGQSQKIERPWFAPWSIDLKRLLHHPSTMRPPSQGCRLSWLHPSVRPPSLS